MGRARDAWEQLVAAYAKQDVEAIGDLYTEDAIFLEPQNPPHEGHLLIQAYLNSWLGARENVEVSTVRMLESDDGDTVAVEWTISYTAGGRRWNDIPRASWFEVHGGRIRYHRDYY